MLRCPYLVPSLGITNSHGRACARKTAAGGWPRHPLTLTNAPKGASNLTRRAPFAMRTVSQRSAAIAISRVDFKPSTCCTASRLRRVEEPMASAGACFPWQLVQRACLRRLKVAVLVKSIWRDTNQSPIPEDGAKLRTPTIPASFPCLQSSFSVLRSRCRTCLRAASAACYSRTSVSSYEILSHWPGGPRGPIRRRPCRGI